MAYTTIDDPTIYFNTVLFTGTASGNKAVTGVGFQPDFVWTKNRVDAYGHNLYDSVRGTGKYLQSNGNSAESSSATSIVSFDSDGFTVGTGDNVQYSSNNGVSWNWKAGTAFSNDASATGVGSIDSSGSINTTAGFSIITYTGTGSAATIAHGLGVQPQMVICKSRGSANSWTIYTVDGGGGKGIFLNDSNGFDSDTSYFNNAEASTTTFPVGSANNTNKSSTNFIAYCFANVKGYSKIGSYKGNGNANGTFIYTGFRPAWFMVKKTSASGDSWVIIDNKRFPHNYVDKFIYADEADAESGSAERLDLLSNGIKIRATHSFINTSGATYLFMAFAESPFVNSNGIPNNAR